MDKNEIATKEDITNAINEMKIFFREIINDGGMTKEKKWLKNKDVKKILGLSDSGLQNLRINGTLPYSRIGGTIYYDSALIQKLFDKTKRNVN